MKKAKITIIALTAALCLSSCTVNNPTSQGGENSSPTFSQQIRNPESQGSTPDSTIIYNEFRILEEPISDLGLTVEQLSEKRGKMEVSSVNGTWFENGIGIYGWQTTKSDSYTAGGCNMIGGLEPTDLFSGLTYPVTLDILSDRYGFTPIYISKDKSSDGYYWSEFSHPKYENVSFLFRSKEFGYIYESSRCNLKLNADSLNAKPIANGTANAWDSSTEGERQRLEQIKSELLIQMRTELFGDDPWKTVKVDITPETKWLIDDFKLKSPPAPDGEILDISQATHATGNPEMVYALGFDFAYLRYAEPVFTTTLDNPNIYNWDTEKLTIHNPLIDTNTHFFKIKAGDVLDNGLKVEEAEYWIQPFEFELLWYIKVKLSGELTMNGLLIRASEYSPYQTLEGGLYFLPDPTQFQVPEITEYYIDSQNHPSLVIGTDKFAAVYDGSLFHVGNANDPPVDISDIFTESNIVPVKVTLKDFNLNYLLGANYGHSSTLVSVEKL
ncbi:MAG: hypothetical protein ACI4JS_06550 [Oscillospiraceae bacterium]